MSDKLLKEIKKQLKVLIESKDITKSIEAFLNSGSYRGVEYFTSYYDSVYSYVIVNIYYDKEFVKKHPKTISLIEVGTNMEITKDVKTYFPDVKVVYYVY